MTHTFPRLPFASALAAFLVASAAALPASAGDSPAPSRWPSFVPQRTDSRFGRAIYKLLDPNKLRGRVHEELVDAVVALGPDAVPTLFAYLAGTMEGPEPEFTPAPEIPENLEISLPDAPREDIVVIDALKRFPRARVVPQITSAMLHANVDVKLVGMRILGDIGDAQAVDSWLDVMSDVPELHLQRAYVQAPSEAALASILQRDRNAFNSLTLRIKTVPPRIVPAIVRAIGGSGCARGVDVLLGLLGRDEALDLVVLAQAARLGEDTLGTLPDEQLNWLRPFLGDDDWRVRREAVAALGRLQDYSSYAQMVALLDDEQRLIAQTAAWSLRRMSGQDFGDDSAAWRSWFESELAWFQSEGARWTQGLEDEDTTRVVDATRELLQHPLFKHDVAQSLLPLLGHENPAIGTSVATALGQIGSRTAIPALVATLTADDEALRTAAWTALVALTGRQLPLDPAAWSAFAQS